MATEASGAVVSITRNIIVLIVHIRFWMAGCGAGENRIVSGVGVAVSATVPLPVMFPGIDWKVLVVVVPVGWPPCRLGVAVATGGWKLCCCMRRITCLVVGVQVAALAGVWRVVVIALVAVGTLVPNGCVGSGQHIIIVVDGEGGRRPPGVGGVTGVTFCREPKGDVTRVDRLVVIRHVASGTLGWRSCVTGTVAPGTFSGGMGTGQGEAR